MRVLVIGGAGYIGSHSVRCLSAAGHEVFAFDDLSLGHRAAVPAGLLIEGTISDQGAVERALKERRIDAVMHFAAFASVPESVRDPAKYYVNNVVGSLNVLEAMRAAGATRIVFSSTAAVYGAPESVPIIESSAKNPINPYGFTKLTIERALADYSAAYGIGFTALRYFNACGAAGDGSIGEDHDPETHLIPIVLQAALGIREDVSLFGADYPTPDGTCIRDYIHVEDLAEAHRVALERMRPGEGSIYNVGTGKGYSVREVIDSARRVTGLPIKVVERPRRPGDPPVLVASSEKLRQETGWSPRFTELDAITASAWQWHRRRPRGYDDRKME